MKKDSNSYSYELLTRGVKAARVLTVSSLILSLLKLGVGLISNSAVLLSDALHSGSDLLTALTSVIGLKIAGRKPDKGFPYGYYKAENLSSLFIALLIIYSAYRLTLEGISRIRVFTATKMPIIAVAAALVSLVVSYFVSKHTLKVGSQIKSQSLAANGKERLLDVLSSLLVLIAIVLSYYGVRYVEGAATIIISLLILKVGIETVYNAVLALMDFSPKINSEISDFLDKLGEEIGYGLSFKNLKIRQAGPFIIGEAVARIPEAMNVKKAYELINRVEKLVAEKFNTISFRIFTEPEERRIIKAAIPLMDSKIAEHFARAQDFLMVDADLKDKKIILKKIVKNENKDKKVRAGLSACHFIIDYGVNTLITKEIGEISLNTLSENLVTVLKAESYNPEKVVDDLLNEKLKAITRATRKKE